MSDVSDIEFEMDEDDEVMDSGSDAVLSSDGEMAESDEEEEVDYEDMVASKVVEKKPYEISYKVKSAQELKDAQDSEVEKLRNLFDMEAETAARLLRSFNWNREKLTEKYMEEPETCLSQAGLDVTLPGTHEHSHGHTHHESPAPEASGSTSKPKQRAVGHPSPARTRSTRSTRSLRSASSRTPSPTDLKTPPPAPSPKVEEFSCPICCLDYEPAEVASSTFALSCGHRACTDCWTTYLESKIRDEGESVRIGCMESGCGKIVGEKIVDGLVGEETKEWYGALLNRTYVDDNPVLRWCPGPECEFAIECKQAPAKQLNTIIPTVHCHCGQTFCFGCTEPVDHRPVICKIAKLWRKKCGDDSETSNWISANTKECTKCQSTIEKNGGCNHMTCKKCKWEFCWVCMGPWTEHGTAWYNCNRYDEKSSSGARDGQSTSRASLERYLHYYNRWANHELSAKLDREFYVKTEKKMEELQLVSDLSWIEVQFARQAVEQLTAARSTLKWTYAMAFYLKSGSETDIFQDNQADLERAVEQLSELLEKPIDKDTVPALRQEVLDRSVYVKGRLETVLDDTLMGYFNGRWKWTVET